MYSDASQLVSSAEFQCWKSEWSVAFSMTQATPDGKGAFSGQNLGKV